MKHLILILLLTSTCRSKECEPTFPQPPYTNAWLYAPNCTWICDLEILGECPDFEIPYLEFCMCGLPACDPWGKPIGGKWLYAPFCTYICDENEPLCDLNACEQPLPPPPNTIWDDFPACHYKCDPNLPECPHPHPRDPNTCECLMNVCYPDWPLPYPANQWLPYPNCTWICDKNLLNCQMPYGPNLDICECQLMTCDPTWPFPECMTWLGYPNCTFIPIPSCTTTDSTQSPSDIESSLPPCDPPFPPPPNKIWIGQPFCEFVCDPELPQCPNGQPRDPDTCECLMYVCDPIWPSPYPANQWLPYPDCKWICDLNSLGCTGNSIPNNETCSCICLLECITECPNILHHFNNQTCECECKNINEVPPCISPLVWNNSTCSCKCPHQECSDEKILNELTCQCECPREEICPHKQIWNHDTCKCECRESCHECTSPQVWDDIDCGCRCPEKVECSPSLWYWSENSCMCECLSKERECCDNKVWSNETCNCECRNQQQCAPPLVWDCDLCECIIDPTAPTTIEPLTTTQELTIISTTEDSSTILPFIETTTESTSTSTTEVTSTMTKSTNTKTLPFIEGCPKSILYFPDCLNPNDVITSCNGCFKMSLESGNFVIRHNVAQELPPVFVYNVTNGQTLYVCTESDMLSFYDSSNQNIYNDVVGGDAGVDARLLDDGQLMVRSRLLNQNTYKLIGNPTSCFLNTTPAPSIDPYPPIEGCSESIIYAESCIYPGDVKISCNGCFKLLIENGDMVVRYNTDQNLPPIFIYNEYTSQKTAIVCSISNMLAFFDSYNRHLWAYGVGPTVDTKLLDDGRIRIQSRVYTDPSESFNLGTSTSCLD